MDYSNVNNPFITLKKLSGVSETEFKAQLNTSPPSVDYDTNKSGMKKANHSLKSSNRATKMRASEDDSFKRYSVTLTDIDNVLYEYFTHVISPQVRDASDTIVDVPVRHASPERWSAIQRDGFLRDGKGQLQRPIIVFTRTGLERDNDLVTFNKYLTMPFVKKFDRYNMYDKFSAINGIKPANEVHNITFPDHVILSYDFTIMTEYVEQMNGIVETINFASDDYWGDPTRFKFRTSVSAFSNSVEVPTDEDRIVTTTFSLTVNAYLLPEFFDNKSTTQRSLTKRKVVWNWETTQDTLDPSENILPKSKNSFILNRKQRKLYITEPSINYRIETWNDESFYELCLFDECFKISFIVNNDQTEYFLWDLDYANVKIFKNETHIVPLKNDIYDLHIKVNSNSSTILTISFKKKLI